MPAHLTVLERLFDGQLDLGVKGIHGLTLALIFENLVPLTLDLFLGLSQLVFEACSALLELMYSALPASSKTKLDSLIVIIALSAL